ncbi:MAG: hypothetical protein M1834_002216 [Cirrosporium novae-zelandiae]|nr:MAG: hypothetical protein M1834_002216 [Cirrosporium novae-zelandiae]
MCGSNTNNTISSGDAIVIVHPTPGSNSEFRARFRLSNKRGGAEGPTELMWETVGEEVEVEVESEPISRICEGMGSRNLEIRIHQYGDLRSNLPTSPSPAPRSSSSSSPTNPILHSILLDKNQTSFLREIIRDDDSDVDEDHHRQRQQQRIARFDQRLGLHVGIDGVIGRMVSVVVVGFEEEEEEALKTTTIGTGVVGWY